MNYTPQSLDIILAKNEFAKDHGIRDRIESQSLKLISLGWNREGDHAFEVINPIHPAESCTHWTLERVDLSRLSLNGLTYSKQHLSANDACKLVSSKTGWSIIPQDIESIVEVAGGWQVSIQPYSIRFKGEFKIKNH